MSAGVDAATTSQSEADEKRGRDIRKREERLGKLDREYAKRMVDCRDGDGKACDDARSIDVERQTLIRGEPEP